MPNIEHLEKEIVRLAQAYYEGRPEVTDYEFDGMVELLRSVAPDSDVLKRTGWGYEVAEDMKLKHIYPVTGISIKFRTVEEFKKVGVMDTTYHITPKLDGGSVVLYYLKNSNTGEYHYDKAISRGDGTYGVDISETMRRLPSVPERLPGEYFTSTLVAIRGEIVIPCDNTIGISTFRNSAVGFSQLLDSSHLGDKELEQHLFIPYTLLPDVRNRSTTLTVFKSLGFITPNCMEMKGEEFVRFMSEGSTDSLAKVRVGDKTYTCPIDGLVLVSDKGDMLAYKLDTDSLETEVVDIEWGMGRTGVYTPVLHVSDITFEDGSTVKRVTGNNISFLRENSIGIGSKIKVIKSGGIIPKVVEVLSKSDTINSPSICNRCNSPLSEDVTLRCENVNCPGVAESQALFRLMEHCCPKFMSDSILSEFNSFLARQYNTEDLAKAYRLLIYSDNNILKNEKLSEARLALFSQYIANLRSAGSGMTYSVFLQLSNIPGLGETHSMTVSNNLRTQGGNLENFLASPETYLDGTNSAVVQNVKKYSRNLIGLRDILHKCNLTYDTQSVSNSDLPKVCLTNLQGSPLTKKQIMDKGSHMYNFEDSVTPETSLVVYCKSGSSKMAKAEKLNIATMHVVEFIQSLS